MPRASGSRRPHELISKFSLLASLDVFKEPPNRSSLQCSKSTSRFSSQDSLISAPSARFDHRHKGSHFAVLPLGLENLSTALGADNRINTLLKLHFTIIKIEIDI